MISELGYATPMEIKNYGKKQNNKGGSSYWQFL